MDIIGYSIKKPVTVSVGVILILLFGLIGVNNLPVQLTPDVETPQITVSTTWGGATPYEMESEVIERQEEALKGLTGLTEMKSESYNSYSSVTLSFKLGTDLDDALLRVSNKMNEVSGYPDNVNKPAIEAAGAQSSPVVWMMLKTTEGNDRSVAEFKTLFQDNVRQHLERVEGVGSLMVFGGTENQLDVTLDAEKMARHNITINQLIGAIQGANRNISAGVLGVGKKNYRIRTVSQFQSPAEALEVVVFDDGIKRVHLYDVAQVTLSHEKESVYVSHNGVQGIVIAVRKEQGGNVLEMSDTLEEVVNKLNDDFLAKNGLKIHWLNDQRSYINTAIDLVKDNVLIGGILAIIVLLLFLRSITSTITTAVAIPISAIGTFIFLWLFDRNLNVVSLAGLSFAVGMLVDNSIVVLENIDRHRKMGKNAFPAAYEGAKEVWGAVLASTATTVAVFLPVVFMQEEAGQLFRDIAIAITGSIILSLIVSVTVIPSLIHQFYKRRKRKEPGKLQKSYIGGAISKMVMGFSNLCLKNFFTRIATVVFFTALSLGVTMKLLPPAEYLPMGNRNLILSILIPPPGYSVEKLKAMGDDIYKQIEPHVLEDGIDGIPQIENLFYVGADRFKAFGATSVHETRAKELMPVFNKVLNSIPGVFGVAIQMGIFESGIGEGRNVEINVSGEDVGKIVDAARSLYGMTGQAIPGAQIRPIPSLETSYPEAMIIPDKEKLAANGMNERDLGVYVDVLMDGRKIEEYRPAGVKQVDLVLKGSEHDFTTPEDILTAPLSTPHGDLIRVGDVATITYGEGMPQINHLERRRTITLQITPPETTPLQTAMDEIQNNIIPGLEAAGKLDGLEVSVGGNADKLTETMTALKWNLLLALIITYLLMAALFENFLYPFIILFSVPLAAAGGFMGLEAINAFVAPQGFDVLTMLGFIILIGTVVNNAILIVHQSLNNVRFNGLVGVAAISDAVETRIRPIFMSATTSILGMLPLVLSTGAGSELYRGLGSILLGGLAVSTVFTLFVIPALLAFVIGFERSRTDEVI